MTGSAPLQDNSSLPPSQPHPRTAITAELNPASQMSAAATTTAASAPVRASIARSHGARRAVPVAIIGAGPYGLSIAAHLRACGVGYRIFGNPMESWRTQMPAGMLLKSEGFASDLYDPQRSLTLERFCAERGLSYAETGLPVPVDVMADYGLHFQQHFIPELENQTVVALDRSSKEFFLQLNNNETVTAQRVIIAVGLNYFQHVPPALAHLPREFVSHSSQHRDLRPFAGSDVTVVGGGASALELTALLHEAGAHVRLVARRRSLEFLSKPGHRSLWHRMRYPLSGIGGGWKSCFFTKAPMLFRYLPEQTRLHTIRTYLGPAGGWFVKDRIEGHFPVLTACTPVRAEVQSGRIHMHCHGSETHCELTTDHVIAATGYQVNVDRLSLLSGKIRSSLQCFESIPVLSGSFESSVPGLYFVGLASAPSFGPVMRFLYGAGYTARRISKHIQSLQV